MITISNLSLPDYEGVVDMYYDFTKEVYAERKIGERYFFYKVVEGWINSSANIIVAKDGDVLVGFSKCKVDDCAGLTESVYQCDFAYVKPEYRKGRAAFMLYNNSYEYAKELGIRISSQGRIENGVADMMQKHFGLKQKFTVLEG